MSAYLDVESNWNFRILDKRLVIVKTKSEPAHKAAVLDALTNLIFTVQVPDAATLQQLTQENEYLLTLKVYTSKSVDDVDKEFIAFFEAVDIEQNIDDFIKAYWVYPGKIRFELVEVEEP